MKKLFYIFSLISAAALVTVSCQKEEDKINPADNPADAADCYGVYFPVQDASGDHIFSPVDDPVIEITVARDADHTNGAITVPVKATFSEEGIFDVEDIVFADGQAETTFKVRFDKAVEGTNYSAHFVIEDNAYASIYSTKPIGLDFSIMRVEMLTLQDAKGEKDATLTFTLGWWGLVVEANVKYYEVDGVRTCETFNEKVTVNGNEDAGDVGFWGGGEDNHLHFTWYTKKVSEEGYQAIDIPKQYLGYDYDDWKAKPISEAGNPIFAYDWFNYLITDGGYAGGWPDWEGFLDRNPGAYDRSYYDGNGGFYLNFRYYIPGLGGWTPAKFDTVGISEGYTRVDFGMKGIETDYTDAGELPLAFYVGNDVSKVQFVAAAGELTATQIANNAAAIVAGTAENVYTLTEFTDAVYKEKEVKVAVTGITLPASGVYTIIAVTYDNKDKAEAADNGSLQVNYVAAGDEDTLAVDITCGISSAAKYAAQGVNSDNALEVWVYGKDIVDAKIAVVKYIDLVSDYAGVINNVIKSKSVEASVIDAINGDGYVSVVQKLLPGTEYYTVVWASNGYEQDVFISSESCFTTGDPLPIYMDYTSADYFEDGALAGRDDIIGTWNYYGTDAYGSLGIREYLGKVVVTASETPTEGPDDSGLYDEYVNVTGLFGDLSWLAAYGMPTEATVEMDVYNGIVYNFQKINNEGTYNVYLGAKAQNSWGFTLAYGSAFIPVADGYYAFVDVSKYAASYNFCGLGLNDTENGWIAKIWDPLLVDPAKDNNGVAPASLNASINSAKKIFAEAVNEVVLTGDKKADMRSIIDRYNQLSKIRVYTDLKEVKGVCPVKNVKVELHSTNVVPTGSTETVTRISPLSK